MNEAAKTLPDALVRDGEFKFPTEYFDEIFSQTDVRERIRKISVAKGVDTKQPNLFSFSDWTYIFGNHVTEDQFNNISLLSILTAWGFNKVLYSVNDTLLTELSATTMDPDESEKNHTSVLQLPHGCVYVNGGGSWPSWLEVHGFWLSIQRQGNSGVISWVLNTDEGLVTIGVPLDARGIGVALEEFKRFSRSAVNVLLQRTSSQRDIEMWDDAIKKSCYLVYYLCARNADIVRTKPRHALPTYPCYQKDPDTGCIVPPAKVSHYDVGNAVGKALAESEEVVRGRWIFQGDRSFWAVMPDVEQTVNDEPKESVLH